MQTHLNGTAGGEQLRLPVEHMLLEEPSADAGVWLFTSEQLRKGFRAQKVILVWDGLPSHRSRLMSNDPQQRGGM